MYIKGVKSHQCIVIFSLPTRIMIYEIIMKYIAYFDEWKKNPHPWKKSRKKWSKNADFVIKTFFISIEY